MLQLKKENIKKVTPILFGVFLLLLFGSCTNDNNTFSNNSSIVEIGYAKSNATTINAIKDIKFSKFTDSKISYRNGFYWFKVKLNENIKKNEELFFQVEEPSIDFLAIYNTNKLLKSVRSKKGNNIITIKIKHSGNTSYYINANFKRQVHFPLNIYNTSQFYKAQEKKNLGFGLYYGIAIMVFILNLIFYISLKDSTFLFYSIFMACINLSFTGFDGVLYLFFSQSKFDDYLLVFHLLIQIFGALFASKFLSLSYFYPKLDLFGKLFIVVPAVFYVIFYFTNNFLYFAIADFFGLLVLAYYWFMGILMLKKEEFAKFFVVGYCMALFAALFYLTPLNFGFSAISATFNQLKFGNIVEMLILTYAITYRVKILHIENKFFNSEIKKHIKQILELEEQLEKKEKIKEPSSSEDKISAIAKKHNLTDRESDILFQIVNGLKYAQIADKLFISVNTVKYHMRNIYEKLDVKKRTDITSKILFDK